MAVSAAHTVRFYGVAFALGLLWLAFCTPLTVAAETRGEATIIGFSTPLSAPLPEAKDSTALAGKAARQREKEAAKAQQKADKLNMRQDLTRDQQQQLNERVKALDGVAVGQHVRISGGARGVPIDGRTDSIAKRARFIRSLPLSDSLLRVMAMDSLTFAGLPDSTLSAVFSDSLLRVSVPDSVLVLAPFKVRSATDTTHIGAADRAMATGVDSLGNELKHRFSITQDTISAGRHTIFSLIAPGFGQVYNRQPWKLPILYGGVGGFLTGGLIFHSKYKTYKAEYQRAVDLRLPPELQKRVLTKMRSAGSGQTLMFGLAGATYLYFVADAVFNYRGPMDPVRKATTLAAIFPGMGFVYTKTYWRIPVYYGGFIALATVVDYNGRNYQRYKRAYDALTDGNPSTVDEFNGRYSPELLSRVRSSYRRDRDLAIIGLAAAYLLSVVDTYVIASLKNWDVDQNLSVRVEPSMIDTRVNDRSYSPSQGATAYGLALKIRF